ncbi:MAG: Asp-tRNA(Asn)/Glu-tRNA(Gln) amidotransferase subunit GatB, partial [Bifidobacteriaceae bacterium]|nr:Asp-tRNA(Asn)/Glu-tRNA(Gln) amidotransferase subunit GatB [Bifidobacteriaceae bacterium]
MSELMSFDAAMERFDPVMGIEIHVELNTKTKMFCACANQFGAPPNSQVCPVCLGLPGAMPAVNHKAVESAIRLGLALNCRIAERSTFARKNYFYPDLSKDYQISQYEDPIDYDGHLEVELSDGEVFRIGIERAHMEEDAAKNTHVGGDAGRIQGADYTLVDYNRGGTPLVEIVTKPIEGAGARAPELARAYVAAVRELVIALGISDARMEQGSIRADVNLSLRAKADTASDQTKVPFGKRSETKNVNSLRAIEKAIRYEVRRQAALLAAGRTVDQETRHWHEDTESTSPGR